MERPVESLAEVSTVLIDIGGVLYVDPWETVLLTPGGIAQRLGLPREAVDATARRLWPDFATRMTREAEYWEDLFAALGLQLDDEVVDVVRKCSEDLLRPLPTARGILSRLSSTHQLGVISDNTTFWYKRQEEDLSLRDYADQDLVFVSSSEGTCKGGDPSLYQVAAERCIEAKRCNPASTLVVDDRPSNLIYAAAAGFRTLADAELAELIR